MPTDPRVDAYIARQADFARPILDHLRKAIHAACSAAEETLKWGMPTFMYKGEQLASMAAFKAHATFGFWKGSLITGGTGRERDAMGQFGRITGVADLPDQATLRGLIAKAMELNEQGIKAPRSVREAKPALPVPDDLTAALSARKAAGRAFAGFSFSARREYIEWITSAKQPATRQRRLEQAIEWIAEGKKRNWKYEQC
jgi:uncharacterized protein YdeI (YjbR/CyaY-like superfamily)